MSITQISLLLNVATVASIVAIAKCLRATCKKLESAQSDVAKEHAARDLWRKMYEDERKKIDRINNVHSAINVLSNKQDSGDE